MNKFLNAGSHYFPVSAVIAVNVSADDDDCVVSVAGIQGTASSDTLTITGGNGTSDGAAMTEALIEEINFGKQAIIKLADFHAKALSAAHAD
jgi:hypothetical protein